MGVSTVIRAEEHLTNTVRQVLILEALGYTPPQYAHLSLVLGEDRSKLSKRHGATSVDQFRREGFLPQASWPAPSDALMILTHELVPDSMVLRGGESPDA